MVRTVIATGRSVTSLFTLLIAALVCATATPSAHSASLERLGDGRVVIKAFGEKLAFREKDASAVGFYWPKYNCDPKGGSGSTLAHWLDDPRVAECLNRTIPDEFLPGSRQSLTFKIYLTFQDGRLYPGAGKRIDRPLSDVSPLYPGAIKTEELPETPFLSGDLEVRLRDPYTGLECLSPVEGPPDALGYQILRAGKSPSSALYTLPADRRPGHTSKPLCVTCSQLSGCFVVLRSSDKVVSLSLGWRERDILRSQPSWSLYDVAARRIAQSIFIDRAPGDVQ
jgi:hypothetical protein